MMGCEDCLKEATLLCIPHEHKSLSEPRLYDMIFTFRISGIGPRQHRVSSLTASEVAIFSRYFYALTSTVTKIQY